MKNRHLEYKMGVTKMIIKVLAENTSVSEKFGSEHGLSLYLETKGRRILFDTGASALFARNAEKMGVNLTQVDFAVISHGHYDHGGGLEEFLRLNEKAPVYVHERAFEEYYAKRPNAETVYIGLNKSLLLQKRFLFAGDYLAVDDDLTLFSGVKDEKLKPSGNRDLLMKAGDSCVEDDFAHEQNLIVQEDGKTILIAGCAHKGILNILEKFHALRGCFPDVVLGGFHLYNPAAKKSESPEVVAKVAEYLMDTGARYYTCHCTGLEAYNQLKDLMGGRMGYLSTGTELSL